MLLSSPSVRAGHCPMSSMCESLAGGLGGSGLVCFFPSLLLPPPLFLWGSNEIHMACKPREVVPARPSAPLSDPAALKHNSLSSLQLLAPVLQKRDICIHGCTAGMAKGPGITRKLLPSGLVEKCVCACVCKSSH